jgi:hypothetical protein
MRPLTVITGILFGSCVAIFLSLSAVLVTFLILGDDHPRIRHEFGPLVSSVGIFLGMTTVCGVSFYSLLVNHPARRWALALMWASLAATTWYYLP